MGIYRRKSGDYYIDFYFQGRRYRERVGPNKTLAQAVLNKRKVEIAEKRYLSVKEKQTVSFETLSADFLNKYSKVNKKSWWRDTYSIQALSKHFGGMYADEITVQAVEKYKSERIKTVKPATVNTELTCLKNMFNRAVDWGTLEKNPIAKVKPFNPNNNRLRFLEKNEIRRLLEYCPPKLKCVVTLAVNTGMRKGEIQALKWRDIDFQNEFICIPEQKNGEKSYQPLNHNVKNALLTIKKHKTSPYVFCKDDGGTYNVRKSFDTALKKADIQDFHFHDLRHTFASHLTMAGIDLNTVRELMRHKDYKMTLRYAHLSKNHTTKAVNILATQLEAPASPALLAC